MSAYDHDSTIYDDLGFQVAGLGCIMLDVNLPGAVFNPDLHWHTPDRHWLSGQQSGTAHVTLLYGLLTHLWKHQQDGDVERAKGHYQDDVAEVLKGWIPPSTLTLGEVDTFPSTFKDEPYTCVIAHVYHLALIDAHQRLSLLPHIDTFPRYLPHVTLGVVKNDADASRAVRWLQDAYENLAVETVGLNYGKFR